MHVRHRLGEREGQLSKVWVAIAMAVIVGFSAGSARAYPVCTVTDFGARAGDDDLDTEAIQQAIDRCATSGGQVVIPLGRFVAGTIRLRSNVELHLAPGAVLQASTRLRDFQPIPELHDEESHRAFIVGTGVQNAAITGLGTIDGAGQSFWANPDQERVRFGVIVQGCSNVRIRDVTIRDTQMFLAGVMDCDNVVVDGVTLTAPTDSPNTDGLQIIDSSDVRVSNCLIDVGDDGIVTKARRRVIERLQVVNCRISSDDGAIKFGTRSESGVRDSLFSNIAITGSRYGVALFMIHGGVYENNRFDNIRIATGGRHRRHLPIFVDIDDRADRPERQGEQQRPLGVVRGLSFDGIDITTGGNILIGGHPRSPVTDLTLSNIRMRITGAQDVPATAGKPMGNRRFRPVPGSPDHSGVNAHIVLGNVADARLTAVDVRGEKPADRRPGLAIVDGADVNFDPALAEPR
jgi:Glycosyl hydrolases family 28